MSTWRYTARTNGKVRLCSLSFRQLTTSTFNPANFESAKVGSVSIDSHEPFKKTLMTLKKDVEVFTWGSGQEGALGHGTFEDLSVPKAVARLKSVVVREVVCGAGHSLILTEDCRIYSWGFNKVGQLGLGDFVDRTVPCEVSLPRDVAHIRSGAGHCFALTKGGRVYSWGFSEYYQTGLNSQDNQNSPVLIRNLRSISDVSCGITHTLLLTLDGRVLSVGYNSQGQCGVGRNSQFCTHPEPVALNLQIKKVAAGGAHSLFLTTLGTVYACGLNSSGQCGGTAQAILSPEPVKVGNAAHFVTETEGLLEGVSTVAAGEETSAALTYSGELLVWGWNGCGQLGQGHFMNLVSPTKVDVDEPVSSVSCGVCLVAFVTASGKLYKAGWEGDRNAFLKTPRSALVSKAFDDNFTVQLVSCGRTHIVATAMKSPVIVPEPLQTKESCSFELEAEKPTFGIKSSWKNRLSADKEPDKLMPILSMLNCQSLGTLPARKQDLEENRYNKTFAEAPISRSLRRRSVKYKMLLEQGRTDTLTITDPYKPGNKGPDQQQNCLPELLQTPQDALGMQCETRGEELRLYEEEGREAKSKSMPPIETKKKAKKLEAKKMDPLLQFFDRELQERRRPPSSKHFEFEIVKAKIAIIDNRIQSKQRALQAKTRGKEEFISPSKRTGGGYNRALLNR